MPPIKKISASLSFKGDKSISHRLVLISLLLSGTIRISNISDSVDVKTAVEAVEKLGITVEADADSLVLTNKLKDLSHSDSILSLNCGNSATVARLLAGILCSLDGKFVLYGDASLLRRQMIELVNSLKNMGAAIESENGFLPITIQGKSSLNAFSFVNLHPSAQLKSAQILAALRARGTTHIKEAYPTRNHTELLLQKLAIKILDEPYLAINGPQDLCGNYDFDVPGDISSAAFFAVAAAIKPSSSLTLKNICLNQYRVGFLRVLERMGAKIIINYNPSDWEKRGDVIISGTQLRAITIKPEEVTSLIDELPVLAVAMANAVGVSNVYGATSLRKKESDRIAAIVGGLKQLGVSCFEREDGFSIEGPIPILNKKILNIEDDHRIVMSFAIMASNSEQGLFVPALKSAEISYPNFLSDYLKLANVQ